MQAALSNSTSANSSPCQALLTGCTSSPIHQGRQMAPFPTPLPQQAPHVSLRGPFSFTPSPTLRPNSRHPPQHTWQRSRGTQRLKSSQISSHSPAPETISHSRDTPFRKARQQVTGQAVAASSLVTSSGPFEGY